MSAWWRHSTLPRQRQRSFEHGRRCGCLGRHPGLLAVRLDGEAPVNVTRLSADLWLTTEDQAQPALRPQRAKNVWCAARTFAETAFGCNGPAACPNSSTTPSI